MPTLDFVLYNEKMSSYHIETKNNGCFVMVIVNSLRSLKENFNTVYMNLERGKEMIFRSQELEAFVQEIAREINLLLKQYPSDRNRNILIGKIGELVIGRGIKETLLGMGYYFRIDMLGEYGFNIERQYNANENEIGGIDFLVKIYNSSQPWHILIEVKNWNHYVAGIPPSVFSKEILDRFASYDDEHNWTWVVTMNVDNIPSIEEECKQNQIHILPLKGQLTESNATLRNIRCFVLSFISEFASFLLREFKDVRPRAYETQHDSTRAGIIYDYIRGLPKGVIARTYNIKEGYVERVVSEARREGIEIPDRRTREWRRHYRRL